MRMSEIKNKWSKRLVTETEKFPSAERKKIEKYVL